MPEHEPGPFSPNYGELPAGSPPELPGRAMSPFGGLRRPGYLSGLMNRVRGAWKSGSGTMPPVLPMQRMFADPTTSRGAVKPQPWHL